MGNIAGQTNSIMFWSISINGNILDSGIIKWSRPGGKQKATVYLWAKDELSLRIAGIVH